MTAGVDGQTMDAMSLDRVNRIIENLKDEKYIPNPARRTYIPKKLKGRVIRRNVQVCISVNSWK